MKKFLAIAVIAASLTSCSDDKKTEDTVVSKDTAINTMPVTSVDTAKVVTTTETTTTVDTIVKEGDVKMVGGQKTTTDNKMEVKKK